MGSQQGRPPRSVSSLPLIYEPPYELWVPALQVTGTRRWLRKLGLPVKTQWRPWKSATGQVGGYFERYDGLTLATVRDAGHMVRP